MALVRSPCFSLDDVGTGVHNVVVQVQLDFDTSVQEGEAQASALVGKGAVVVEEIRLVAGARRHARLSVSCGRDGATRRPCAL